MQKRTNAITVWVEPEDRIPPEPAHSCTVSADMADIAIWNSGTKSEFLKNIGTLFEVLNDERTVITSSQCSVIEINNGVTVMGRRK